MQRFTDHLFAQTDYVVVNTPREFLNALGSNRVIRMNFGQYDFSTTAGTSDHHYRYEDVES